MRVKELLGAALLIMATVGHVGHSHAAAARDPRALNVTLADMPAGFTVALDVKRDNAAAAQHEARSLTEENASGRLLSNEREFTRNATTGMLDVESTVIVFKSARYSRNEFAARKKIAATFSHVAIAPIGLDRVAWKYQQVVNNRRGIAYGVLFYRGNYMAIVIVAGPRGMLQPPELAMFARRIDGRIVQVR